MKTSPSAEIYIQSAKKAREAGNYAEAEMFANKAIETVPQSYRAWFIKGEAAGWQTTGTNNRFAESTTAWINACRYTPKNKIEEMKSQIQGTAEKISSAILTMRCNNFKALRDENSKTGILDSLSMVEEQFTALRDKTQIDIYSAALKNTFAAAFNTTAAEVGQAINAEFGEDGKMRVRLGRTARTHTKSSWEHLIEATDCCLALLKTAYELSTDDELCFGICKNYIDLANLTKKTCSGRHTPKKYRCVPGSGIPGSPVKYGPEEILQWEKKKDLHDPEKRNDCLIRTMGYKDNHNKPENATRTIYTKSIVSAMDLLDYQKFILPAGYSVAGDGEDAIETVSKFENNCSDKTTQYRIRFTCKGQDTHISLSIRANTLGSPIDGPICYLLENEKNPLSVSSFIQVVSASVSGICPEIDLDKFETALAEAAYGFVTKKVFQSDDMTCAISGGTKENLACSLLPSNLPS